MEKYGEQLSIEQIETEDEAELLRVQRALILGQHAMELGME